MSKKLFVGNLSWGMDNAALNEVFSQYGDVEEAVIIMDKMSGRSKGFGFVTFTNDGEADAAIEALNGQEVDGREIAVNEARPPQAR